MCPEKVAVQCRGSRMQGAITTVQVADGKYRLSRKQALLDLGDTDGPPVGHTARYRSLAALSLGAYRLVNPEPDLPVCKVMAD